MLRLFKQYYSIRNIFFVSAEGAFIYWSIIFSSWLIDGNEIMHVSKVLNVRVVIIAFVCIVCMYWNDVYDLSVTHKNSELIIRLARSYGFALIILSVVYALFRNALITRGLFFVYVPIVMVVVFLWRFFYLFVLNRGFFNVNIAVLGSGELSENIIRVISSEIDCGYRIAAVVNDNLKSETPDKPEHPLMERENFSQTLYEVISARGVKKIVVALKEKRGNFPLKELLECRVAGVEIIDGNSFYEMLTGKLSVTETNPAWLIFSEGFRITSFRKVMKWIEDAGMSVVLLITLLPVILMTILLIKLESRGPVLFSQERIGTRRKPYRLYKFRSMVVDAEKESGPVWAMPGDHRVTRMGRFIRKWRVDEIPQLWNVLKGDMSLVGPRPEREFFIDQLEEIVPYYSERFTVKPGLTGWAQVCYGYGDSVEDAVEKLNYDLFYIKNMSIFMDVVIIFRTVKTVLFGVGAR